MNIKRLREITSVDDNFYVEFIKDNNLLSKFFVKHFSYWFKRAEANPKPSVVDDIDRTVRRHHTDIENLYSEITIDDEQFYLMHKVKQTGSKYILYKELPLIIDDDNFIWKYNAKYNAREATVIKGAFEYLCIINADGNGKVIVRYNKCENFHRNKVTIAEFTVYNAYNEKFLDAIDKWTTEFKNSIAA